MVETSPPTALVVIGSSAGGIEALSVLITSLRPDFPAALVIAQHLDPHRPSLLAPILARTTKLPVVSVTTGTPLARGTVYVAPANRHVQISDHQVVLLPDQDGRSTPSIDGLLTSAARQFGEQLIAVILTGLGSDGAAGAYAVKEAGGTVIIQDPMTARFPSMPQSLAPQTVDIVADLPRIGPIITDLLAGLYVPTQADQEQELHAFLHTLREINGIDFSSYKTPTILRRLQRRIVATDTENLAGYRQYLESHPEESQRLISSFLIKVTQFMRDPEVFAVIRDRLLPELIEQARRGVNELRLWSAGCASGEEAYSLAILVAEVLGDELDRFNVKIFATDLDGDALAFARRGLYLATALSELPAEIVQRYFTRRDGGYEVRKRIRSMTVFGQHDLAQRSPFPNIDLVLCRNVLIYFTKELQQRTIQLFAFSLHSGGYLVLGKAETVGALDSYFALNQQQPRVYQRSGDQVLIPPPRLHGTAGSSRQRTAPLPRQPAVVSPARAQDVHSGRGLAEQLLQRLPVGIVVVDERYAIQLVNNLARQMLGIHTAAIGADLMHLADHLPSRQVRGLIDAAIREDRHASIDSVTVDDPATGDTRYLQIDGYPQRSDEPGDQPPRALIVLTNVTHQVASRRALEQATTEQAAQTLTQTHTVAELQAANEALRRSNQAVQSTLQDLATGTILADEQTQRIVMLSGRNAELQASVERFEREAAEHTAREQTAQGHASEQARRIEHLITANQDLTTTNEELLRLNEAERIAIEDYLISGEEAQASKEEIETLNEELQATNEELETLNEELQSTVEELNTSNADLEARTVELQELATSLEQQQRISEDERARLQAVLASMRDAVLMVDREGALLLTNAAYQRWFGAADVVLEDEHTQPLPIEATPRARAARGETFSMTLTMQAPDGARCWFEANGQPVSHDTGVPRGVVVIRDITDRSLRRLQEQFLSMASHELRTPLVPMQGYLDMLHRLLQARPDNEQMLLYVGRARRSLARLTQLVNDLLDLSRLENGKFRVLSEPVPLQALVTQTIEIAQNQTQQPIRVNVDDESLVALGDPGRLQQVLLNLLTNAILYAPSSKQIDVELRKVAGMAEITVRDYGPGIPQADLPLLFTRFYQVEHAKPPNAKGLGLGLFICEQIVSAHGGTIDVTSTEGQGTSFAVRLPLAPPEASGAAA